MAMRGWSGAGLLNFAEEPISGTVGRLLSQ